MKRAFWASLYWFLMCLALPAVVMLMLWAIPAEYCYRKALEADKPNDRTTLQP